jgi:tRNA (adenine22-N1)-methyltransferase
MIFDMIPPCRVFADVGADHAYLAIHLLSANKIERAVISEISPHALERAKRNIARLGLAERCEFILADGLAGLPDDADVINISGMGADTMAGILARDKHKIWKQTLVLSPNRDIDIIRAALLSFSYNAVSERVTMSKGRYYVAVRANPSDSAGNTDIALGDMGVQNMCDPWLSYFRWRRGVHAATAPALSSKSYEEALEWKNKLAQIDKRIRLLSQI